MPRMGDYDGAAAPNPAWGFHPQTPSSLRGGLKGGTWQTQVKQAYSEAGDASLPDSRFFMLRMGGYDGAAAPNPA